MRFLHLITSIDRRGGGPVEGLLQLGLLHRKLGHSIQVACVDAPGNSFLQDIPFPVHPLGPPKTAFAYSARMTGWLRQNGSQFDAAIVHGLWQHPSIAVRTALSGRVPYFIYPHGMLDPWFNDRYLRKHIKKTIFWPLMRRSLDEATGVIFTTEQELERSARAFFPFRWKGMVAPLGIASPPEDRGTQLEAVKKQFPQLGARRFLLFFGRIHPKKGCDLILRSFAGMAAEFPDIDLVMAGPGDPVYIQSLQKMFVHELRDRVIWTGMVSGPAKWGLLRSADAFVLPSHQENFAVAVVEAMAAGTPVLISDKVQIWRDVVRAGAGLAESDTAEGTERLLRRWMELDPSQRTKFRRCAEQCYRSRFTADQAGETVLLEMLARVRSSKTETSDALRKLCANG